MVDDLWNYIQSRRGILGFGVYVTAREVSAHLGSEEGLKEALSLCRRFGIDKVYLDTYRGGHFPGGEVLKKARDFLRGNGLCVAGGITTTTGEGFGRPGSTGGDWLCFTHRETQEDLERLVRADARLFDEIILDDFFCTRCECGECQRGRGEEGWDRYRLRLLSQVARERVIGPAREENPDIRLILKYPQWYDRFHDFGYDAVGGSEIFDRIWIGTETRNPETPAFGYVQQYEGYFNFRWLSAIAGEKAGGAWFDHIDCPPEVFVEQGVGSVLAGAREIILFHYGDLLGGNEAHPLFFRKIPLLFQLAQIAQSTMPWGVYAYKPPHSDGGRDKYIFDYLGMLGVPLVPCATFPGQGSVFLSYHAGMDPAIGARILGHLREGGTVVMTAALLERLRGSQDLLERVGHATPPLRADELLAEAFSVDGKRYPSGRPVALSARLAPQGAEVWASALVEGEEIPVITVRKGPEGGCAIVVNLKTFEGFPPEERLLVPERVALLELPEALIHRLRDGLLAPLGVHLRAPGKVALYLYGTRYAVVENFNDRAVDLQLRVPEGEVFSADVGARDVAIWDRRPDTDSLLEE